MAYVGARVIKAYGNIKKGMLVRLIESNMEERKPYTKWHLVEFDKGAERAQQTIPHSHIVINNIHGLKGDV